jgi:aspartokinase-like uncharacterized kinase
MSLEAVVKLGGSYWASPHLRDWLSAIAALTGRIVLVPGGGPFADAVRKAQAQMGFRDDAAHVMALLAMEQYARALAGLCPTLAPAASEAAIRRLVAQKRVPAWCPVPMALRDPSLPASWTVTSDSLALWLARRLRADRVILIKQISCERDTSPAELARAGIVDEAFPAMWASSGVGAFVIGPESRSRLPELVAGHG